MRFVAVAVDYDGTLARAGVVDAETTLVIREFLASGRKLILVTGRILKDLLAVFPEARLCTRIVAENGAVLYHPETQGHKLLAAAPPQAFIDSLIRKHVTPLEIGESIVATLRPHEVSALEAIRDLGLEHHVVFNRESVMILPSGVNKATGLKVALKDLALSHHNVVAIGDSENDHALLDAAECSVAVNNAIPTLKEQADLVASGEAGAGVSEILRALVHDDLRSLVSPEHTRCFVVGSLDGAGSLVIPCLGENILLIGSREDTVPFLSAMIGTLASRQYQCCVIGSQGIEEAVPGVLKFGTAQKAPTMAEIMTAMDNPDSQILVHVAGLPQRGRVAFAGHLLDRMREKQEGVGRPHRIFFTDSEALFPDDHPITQPRLGPTGLVYSATDPSRLPGPILRTVAVAIAIGTGGGTRLRSYAQQAGLTWPQWTGPELLPDEGLIWKPGQVPQRFHIVLRPEEHLPRP
jgi:hydroxymethylpyrimidine pyrophosphatase-like HAD family hydrolase